MHKSAFGLTGGERDPFGDGNVIQTGAADVERADRDREGHSVAKPLRRGWSYTGPRYTEQQMVPYAVALGQLVLSWNDLHERLASLFWTTMGGGWIDRPIAVWNSVNFDRARRGLLRAAVGSAAREQAEHPSLVDDVKWLLDRCDELEEARNNAVHSPLLLVRIGIDHTRAAATRSRAVPDVLLRNPRALKLQQKDLLSEFRRVRASVLVLRDFAVRIDRALTADGAVWPRRPTLPNRGQAAIKRPASR